LNIENGVIVDVIVTNVHANVLFVLDIFATIPLSAIVFCLPRLAKNFKNHSSSAAIWQKIVPVELYFLVFIINIPYY
jgi:hypothetical protein